MKYDMRRDELTRGIYNDREKSEDEIYFNRALFKMMLAKLKGEIAKGNADKNDNAIS